MSTSCQILLDVDTGIDDAMAIVLALKHPDITLRGLTTVYGNVDVESAARNTLHILETAERTDVPVAMGASRSLTRPYHQGATHIHGVNGLGDIQVPEPGTKPVDCWGPDFIISQVRELPGELTLVAVGPMTNVAHALMKAPDIAKKLKSIVMMGSTLIHPGVPGIPSPMADPNFYNDPEAVRIILASGARLIAVGMDVTMQTRLDAAMINEMSTRGCAATKLTMQAARFYLDAYETQYPGIGYCGLHDPLAVAVAADMSLVTLETLYADIECEGTLTRGQLIPDRRRGCEPAPNIEVAVDVDRQRFEHQFVQMMLNQQ